jgi:hypothetical protein
MYFPSGARVTTISAISSFSASQISSFQKDRQAFNQLTNALQSGDLTAAQNAYNTLSSSPMAQGDSPFAQALQQIGKDLQSNNLSGAQDALKSLQQQQRAHRGHHHHHHDSASQLATASDRSSSNGATASGADGDASSDGTNILDISLTIESTNKIDIKA